MLEILSFPRGESLSLAAYLKQAPQRENGVLGALYFSAAAAADQLSADWPCLHVPMQRLDAGAGLGEVWHSSGPLTQGTSGDIHYRYDGRVVFGVLELSETALVLAAGKTPLQQTAESAYRQLFALLKTLRYPYLYRCWNYIADINAHSFGVERYQQFNRGRQDAFLACGRDVVGNVPAACALGSARGPLALAFMAGCVAPLYLENPRQTSACQYPAQYGERRPTFSRASLVVLGQDEVLLVSGTASIVGHASQHPADVVAQTRETMSNIEAVLREANRHSSRSGFALAGLHFRVYVRHPADLPQIHAELVRCVGDAISVAYLHADVCRRDLLLEIEAVATHPLASIRGEPH